METGTPNWRTLIVPTIFALACVILAVATWRAFGGVLPLQPKQYEAGIALAQANNLQPNADVRVAGVNIGHIKSISVRGNGAIATLSIQPRYAPLRSDVKAAVRAKSLLGEAFLELTPGSRSARPVPDGGELPATAAEPVQRLDDVLQTFDPATRNHLKGLFTGLAAATDRRAQHINDALGNAAPAADALHRLSTAIDGQGEQLNRLVDASGQVIAAVADRQGSVRSVVQAGNRTLSATAIRERALAQTIRALPRFTTALVDAAGALQDTSPALYTAARSLRPAAARLPAALDAIRRDAPTYRRTLSRLPSLIAAARRGLPPLTTTLRGAAAPLREINETARHLQPFLQLAAANRNEIAGVLANVGGVLNGVQRLPSGELVHYGSGLPTIWNETLAGWIKRLPTNRLNPYPKPGSAADIAAGGLKAYDCRNLHNTEYLPPTGSGAPSCLLQGPWTFNGETRYYPALQAAPRYDRRGAR